MWRSVHQEGPAVGAEALGDRVRISRAGLVRDQGAVDVLGIAGVLDLDHPHGREADDGAAREAGVEDHHGEKDRKSTRLNSSHGSISYAVFCLKKKNNNNSQID